MTDFFFLGAGLRGKFFARVIDRKGAHIKEVSKKTFIVARHVTLLKKSDEEDALTQVIPKAAGKVGLPCEPVP